MNELLQNCMKYAFAGKDQGNIEVSVLRTDGATEIKVQDDGNGFREVQGSNDGLGLKIVKLLAEEKLGAEFLETSDERGTTAVLRIPDKQ